MNIIASGTISLIYTAETDKVTRYYKLQSSTEAAPSKPTDGASLDSSWITIEPTSVADDKSLYYVDQIASTDGSVKYTNVTKSSEYEVKKVNSRVDTVEGKADQNASDISDTNSRVDDVSSKTDKNTSDISDANDRIDSAEKDIITVKTRITNAETSIENNATEISMKASQTEVNTINDNFQSQRTTTTSMIQNVNGWQFNWDRVINVDNANTATRKDYITFDDGSIMLGSSSSALKVKITNSAIMFKGVSSNAVEPDSDSTAWITGQKFNINEGEIHKSLVIGKIQFAPRPNGNFSITAI